MNEDVVVIKSIPCEFRNITNSNIGEGLRKGRYSGSFHWDIKDFGMKKWVVLGYIDIDWVKLQEEEKLSQEEILLGCLKHLNVVPERKKHAKKDPTPKYGLLEPYRADFKTKDGKSFIIVQLKTNEQANSNFWCEGLVWGGIVSTKKRGPGRPPKVVNDSNE